MTSRKQGKIYQSKFQTNSTHLCELEVNKTNGLGIIRKCYSAVTSNQPQHKFGQYAQIVGTRVTGMPLNDVPALRSFTQSSPL